MLRAILTIIMIPTSAIWESFWRRWFGGGFSETKIGNNRCVQHICNCFFLVGLFGFKFDHLITSEIWLWASIIFMVASWQIEFWTRAHGPMFDMGRDGKPDEKLIARYEAIWYNHYILTPLYDYFHWRKYSFSYDFFSMTIRYTYPCVYLYPFYGCKIWLVGLFIGPVYAWCWTFREIENPRYGSTQMAEWIAGAIVGFGLTVIEPNGFLLQYLH